MEQPIKRPQRKNVQALIQQIGGKNGRKKSVLVDEHGVPLSLCGNGAHRHDVKLLEPTLDTIVIDRPRNRKQHLCADAGYKGQKPLQKVKSRNYIPHIRQRRQEIQEKLKGKKPRRWVVERTLSWFNRFRKLLVSFEKSQESFEALLSLAAALITWRQIIPIYG